MNGEAELTEIRCGCLVDFLVVLVQYSQAMRNPKLHVFILTIIIHTSYILVTRCVNPPRQINLQKLASPNELSCKSCYTSRNVRKSNM